MNAARKIAAFAAAAILGPLCWCVPAGATDYVFPNDAAVQNQCAAVRDAAATIADLAVAYQRIDAECKHYQKARDVDSFFADTDDPAQQIDTYLKNSKLHAALNFTNVRPIPNNEGVYVLFLVVSRTWASGGTLKDLHDRFQTFGELIGDGRLAVWFRSKSDPNAVDTVLATNYFDKLGLGSRYKLGYGDGPFIVVTSVRPDRWSGNSPIVIAKLKNMTPPHVQLLLDTLAQDLRANRQPNQNVLAFEQVQGEFTTFIDRHPNLIASIGRFIITGSYGGK